ncbi:MAG: hypothetical protein D6801_09700 [Alphaproteobacteria bacterium]|nr:MAG: hypothetical protein D6801_09700 [Alphaproteobacteria bacterium]
MPSSSSFAATGPEYLVNTETTSNQFIGGITALSGGGYVVTWYTQDSTQDGSGYAVKAQAYDDEGNAVGTEFLVNTEATTHQHYPAIGALEDGGYVIAWTTYDTTQDGDSWAIKAQIFGADGSTTGREFLVNTEVTGSQIRPAVAGLTGGDFVISWETYDTTQDGSSSAIKARQFGADGTATGAEFLVNSEATDTQYYADIAGTADGGYVIVWETEDTTQDGSSGAIKAQRYDASGTAVGSEFLVNTDGTSDQSWASVAGLAGGGFVVTWRTNDSTQDGSGASIRAQVFDADGATVGSEIGVNTEATDYQIEPSVTALTGGGFAIAWKTNDTTQDGDGPAIKAQVFAADGTKIGGELLVNSEAAGEQRTPEISAIAGGGFVVGWTTYDTTQDGDGTAVKARLFAPPGNRPEAFDDRAFVIKGDKVTIDVLANDTDADGDSPHLLFFDQPGVGSVSRKDGGTAGDTADDMLKFDSSGVRGTTSLNYTVADVNGGTDVGTVRVTSIRNADTETGTSGADRLTGGGADDGLFGAGGGDTLKGKGGDDWLTGGSGQDTIKAGSGDDGLFGDGGKDTLKGQGGSDWLEGGNGKDTLKGGAGSDALFGDGGKDMLMGQGGGDWLDGGAGDDSLDGGSGSDSLVGGNGDDTLDGGAGVDLLAGGNGADTFAFDEGDTGTGADSSDAITDFEVGTDTIDLSAIDAVSGGGDDAFSFVGTAAFSGTAGELRYEQVSGSTLVQADTDGDGNSDLDIVLFGALTLTATDFAL